jgi:hypothetical protein
VRGEYHACQVASARRQPAAAAGDDSAAAAAHTSSSGDDPSAPPPPPPPPEVAALERALVELNARPPPRPILLFLDGLDRPELAAIAAAVVRARGPPTRGGGGGRLWLAATLAAPDDDDGPPELAPGLGPQTAGVRLPGMSKPESTCVVYAVARAHGPHVLRLPPALLMGLYKTLSSHPR